jgi:NDP-sugar pyrophosphorylase family protein
MLLIDPMEQLKANTKKNQTKLVCILAGGIGSRMGEYKSIINKALLPINFKSSINKIFENFPSNTKFIIATGYKKEIIKNYLKIIGNNNVKIVDVKKYTGQGSGPAYSLYKCKKYLKKSFYFISCDTLINKNFPKNQNSNWLGVGKTKKQYTDYCNFLVNSKSEIIKIYDKIKPLNNS